MKQLRLILLGFSLLSPVALSAQALEDGRAPLVTIRFNQPHVYYDQQLYGAVSKAVAAKPDVVFDVVSFAPSSGNPQTDQQWQSVAGRNTKTVIAQMATIGVPAERINVIGRSTPGLRYDETRIYVR